MESFGHEKTKDTAPLDRRNSNPYEEARLEESRAEKKFLLGKVGLRKRKTSRGGKSVREGRREPLSTLQGEKEAL